MTDTTPTAVPTKPWYRSKTMWFNALVAAATAAETQVQLLQPLLPINVYQLIVFVLVTGNAALRTISAARISMGVLK